MLPLEAGVIDRVVDVVRICVGSMLEGYAVVRDAVIAAVVRTQNAADTVDVINVFTGEDVLGVIDRSDGSCRLLP